jgi:hypothetical protein
MSKFATPGVTVPGAIRVTDPDTNMPMFFKKKNSKKTVPAWYMPTPSYHVIHFKSAGARRKFFAGEIKPEEAYNRVPVYRGIDTRTLKQRTGARRRSA